MKWGVILSTEDIRIVGFGETTYSSHSGMSVQELLFSASLKAANRAGIHLSEIDGLIIPDVYSGLKPYEFEYFANAKLNFSLYTDMVAGAGVVNAIEQAVFALQHGKANYILIYIGANQASDMKKFSPSKLHQEDPLKHDLEMTMGYFPQPAYFATLAQRYEQLYGSTEEVRGIIATLSRKHAMLNENAQRKEPMTMEDYYHSEMLFDPLRLYDCCQITDGAAAIILTTEIKARNLKNSGVSVLSAETDSLDEVNPYFFTQADNPLVTAAKKTGKRALEKAGLTHKDIDILQIYDCFTIAVILQLEDLGFCEKGEAIDFIGNGEIFSLDGELPLNTHGGLLSQGFVYGMNHVVESVKQLLGIAGRSQVNDAKIAMVSGLGGWKHGTLILAKP